MGNGVLLPLCAKKYGNGGHSSGLDDDDDDDRIPCSGPAAIPTI